MLRADWAHTLSSSHQSVAVLAILKLRAATCLLRGHKVSPSRLSLLVTSPKLGVFASSSTHLPILAESYHLKQQATRDLIQDFLLASTIASAFHRQILRHELVVLPYPSSFIEQRTPSCLQQLVTFSLQLQLYTNSDLNSTLCTRQDALSQLSTSLQHHPRSPSTSRRATCSSLRERAVRDNDLTTADRSCLHRSYSIDQPIWHLGESQTSHTRRQQLLPQPKTTEHSRYTARLEDSLTDLLDSCSPRIYFSPYMLTHPSAISY